PALAAARVDVREALQGSGRGATGGGRLVRGLLVSSEVALAVVLLIVVTMLAKSFANVQAVAPGFDSTRVLSARLTLPASRFHNRDAIIRFQRAVASQVAVIAAAVSMLASAAPTARLGRSVDGVPK